MHPAKRRKRPLGKGAFGNHKLSRPANNESLSSLNQARLDIRFRDDVERLHALGPRVLYELFAKLGARRMIRIEPEGLVGQYAELDPEIVHALGADRWPPLPLRVVP